MQSFIFKHSKDIINYYHFNDHRHYSYRLSTAGRKDYGTVSKIDRSCEPTGDIFGKIQGPKTISFSIMPSLVSCPTNIGEGEGIATLEFSPLSPDFCTELRDNGLGVILIFERNRCRTKSNDLMTEKTTAKLKKCPTLWRSILLPLFFPNLPVLSCSAYK